MTSRYTEVVYDSLFIYETDFPTPSIALIIGDYEQKSIDVDSTLFSIWHLKGHDYFAPVFEPIMDTIPAQIRERHDPSRRPTRWITRLIVSPGGSARAVLQLRVRTQAQEVMQPDGAVPRKGA